MVISAESICSFMFKLNDILPSPTDLPDPTTFRKIIDDITDDQLQLVILKLACMLSQENYHQTQRIAATLRDEINSLKSRVQDLMLQIDVDNTPVDNNVSHVNYKKTGHITGKFKRDELLDSHTDES